MPFLKLTLLYVLCRISLPQSLCCLLKSLELCCGLLACDLEAAQSFSLPPQTRHVLTGVRTASVIRGAQGVLSEKAEPAQRGGLLFRNAQLNLRCLHSLPCACGLQETVHFCLMSYSFNFHLVLFSSSKTHTRFYKIIDTKQTL